MRCSPKGVSVLYSECRQPEAAASMRIMQGTINSRSQTQATNEPLYILASHH